MTKRPLTGGDTRQAVAVIWDALEGFREDCIPEGEPAYDEQWDEICTAMAWICDALGIDEAEEGAQ